jgi:hypothetical protein
MDCGRELFRIAVATDMHVEGRRTCPQQVVVDRRDLQAVLDHFRHDGVDLSFEQHEITHDHCPAVHRLERDPAAKREPRLDGHAVERDVEVGPRESIAVDIASHRCFPPERSIDL